MRETAQPLNLLFMAQCDEDIAVVVAELLQNCFIFHYQGVTNIADCLHCLNHQSFHAIIGISPSPPAGSEFCQSLANFWQNECHNLPLFTILPPIDIEEMNQYCQLGMTDCILKQQLNRLPKVLDYYIKPKSTHSVSHLVTMGLTEFWQDSPLESRLQLMLNRLHESLKVDRCCFIIPEQNKMKIAYVSEQTAYHPLWLNQVCCPSDHYKTSLAEGNLIIFPQIHKQLPPILGDFIQEKNIKSFVLMPLCHQGEYFGALSLQHCTKAHHWTEEEVQAIRTLAQQSAIALYQNQLQQKLKEHQKRETLLETLHSIFRNNTDIDQNLQEIVTAIGEILGFERVLIMLLDEPEIIAKYEWLKSSEIPSLLGQKFSVSDWQKMLQSDSDIFTKNYHLIPNYIQYCEENPHLKPYQEKSKSLSILSIPIFLGNKIYGGFSLHTVSEFYDFKASEIKTLQKIANAISGYLAQIQSRSIAEKLEQENQHKSELLSIMSHELRTPLTGILGFARMLLEQIYGELNPKQIQYVSAIISSGEHLLNLINDLLDISKIEANREEIFLEPFAVDEICLASLSIVEEIARLQGLELKLEIDENITTCVADQQRVKQILINLLSNAIKFTPKGTITLKVYKTSDQLHFAVMDTGIGIAQEHLEQLFQPFQQIRNPLQRKHKGTGLGLTLCYKLAQLHGGDLTVSSTVGEGSCFTLQLPLN